MTARAMALAAAAASLSKKGIRPTVPNGLSLWDASYAAACNAYNGSSLSGDLRSCFAGAAGIGGMYGYGTTQRGAGAGKRQVEFTALPSNVDGILGICQPAVAVSANIGIGSGGGGASPDDLKGVGLWGVNGLCYYAGAGSSTGQMSSAPVAGDVVGMVVDFTPGAFTIQFYKNGVTTGIAMSTASTSGGLDPTVSYIPCCSCPSGYNGYSAFLNTGSEAFKYPIAGTVPWL